MVEINRTFEHIFNFRDVAWQVPMLKKGCLYRSSYLSAATPQDLNQLQTHQISLVLDLRSTVEQEQYPDPVNLTCQHVAVPIFENEGLRSNTEATIVRYYAASSRAGYWQMIRTYKKMVTDPTCQAAVRTALNSIANHDFSTGGILIHCSAGKDRTGLVMAAVLYLLGVEPTLILTDYLTSNQQSEARIAKRLKKARQVSTEPNYWHSIYDLSVVHPAYLKRAVDLINYSFGGVEQFFTQTLQISPSMVTKLRKKVLVK